MDIEAFYTKAEVCIKRHANYRIPYENIVREASKNKNLQEIAERKYFRRQKLRVFDDSWQSVSCVSKNHGKMESFKSKLMFLMHLSTSKCLLT